MHSGVMRRSEQSIVRFVRKESEEKKGKQRGWLSYSH